MEIEIEKQKTLKTEFEEELNIRDRLIEQLKQDMELLRQSQHEYGQMQT